MLLARGVTFLVFMLAVLVAPHLKADTILFTDNYGTGSETIPPYYFDFSVCAPQQYDNTGRPIAQLPPGSCQPFEGYPYTIAADTIPATVYIGDPGGYVSDKIVTTISPPGPFTWSCTIGGNVVDPCPGITGVNFVFSYGLDLMGAPFTCASVGGCAFTYNGGLQDIGVITWAPGLFDSAGFTTTLQFQYNTPEPSTFSMLVLGLGLAGAVGKAVRSR